MLDRYWHGETCRISPEAPVPVVKVGEEAVRPGGAANVAMNLTALGASCRLLGAAGEDEAGRVLRGLLEGVQGLGFDLLPCEGPTITKLRILSRHQQLLRLDFEPQPAGLAADLRPLFASGLPGVDAVVLSDYGKGTLADPRPFVRLARAEGKPVIIDPKARDFSLYHGATVITPNVVELEAAAGPWRSEGEMVEKAHKLLARHAIGALLITRAERGMTLVTREGSHPIPARAREVFDVTGAGDTVVAWLAAGLAAGLHLLEAAHLANAAAGIAVGKLGASSVTPEELARQETILDEEGLLLAVEGAKARGERIVMTNGCFDILHAGHVRCLNEARALGDRLIVAVNDDASVRRLKGQGRPIHPLAKRMEVLAALGAVDWVVPFGEDTPERLVCRVKPHILAKGGDYRPEDIAGGHCAGAVRVLDYVEGHSTTGLLNRLKGTIE